MDVVVLKGLSRLWRGEWISGPKVDNEGGGGGGGGSKKHVLPGKSTEGTEAMFTLYRIGFCSVAKVAPVQCEQELMFCCRAEIVPKRSQCEQKPYPLCNLQRSLLI